MEVLHQKDRETEHPRVMSQNPLNLAFRFLLEIAGWAAFAYWGWAWGGFWRWPLAIGVPLLTMVIWAVFRTPGDNSANPKAPVPVQGIVRLGLEMAFFGLAVVALFNAGSPIPGAILAVLVIAHYIVSWDRVMWLLLTRIGPRTPEEEWPDMPA